MSAAAAVIEQSTVRFEIPSDRNAILSSWLRSYYRQKPRAVAEMKPETYFAEHQALIKQILEREETVVLVVPSPAAEAHLCSWLCGEVRPRELVLHWGVTFRFARANGFFDALLERLLAERGDRQLIYTHSTKSSRAFAEKHGATFNPMRLFA